MCNTLHAWCIIRIYYLLLIFCFFRYYYCVPLVNEKPGNWSYFVFAQQWPPAACLNVPPHEGCQIPKGVDDWIVHGLWPTRDKGYPSFCNNSWPFNPQALKSILQALEVKWPNIYAHSSENKFWQHEWLKHGTCAASLPMFDTELKYFKKSLELHDRLNIYEFIRKASISPSKDYPVLLSYIRNAITLHVNKTTKLFCKHHKQYSYPVLTSMYVCLDKDEQVIDCDKIDEPECDNAHVFYLPFNNTDSVRKNYN